MPRHLTRRHPGTEETFVSALAICHELTQTQGDSMHGFLIALHVSASSVVPKRSKYQERRSFSFRSPLRNRPY